MVNKAWVENAGRTQRRGVGRNGSPIHKIGSRLQDVIATRASGQIDAGLSAGPSQVQPGWTRFSQREGINHLVEDIDEIEDKIRFCHYQPAGAIGRVVPHETAWHRR